MTALYALAAAVLIWRTLSLVITRDEKRNANLFLFLLFNFVALLGLELGRAGVPLGYPVAALAAVLAWPWLLTRAVLVPLGRWRLAYYVGSQARLVWPEGGGGLVAAAWALLRRRGAPPPRAVAFLEAKLRAGSLGGAHIAGAGLLAAARGDEATARRLLESLELLDPRAHRAAHRVARDFLIAAAAEAGDWDRARRLGGAGFPVSRLGRFVAAAAARLAGAPEAPSDAALRGLWLMAPRRLRTWPLLRRALAVRFAAAPRWRTPMSVDVEAAPADPMGRALAIHVELLDRPTGRVELDDLELLGASWDAAVDSGVLEDVARRRSADLGAEGAARVAAEFREQIDDEIAGLVRGAGVCIELLHKGSPTLERAARRVREALLTEIELAFTALEVRTEENRRLPGIDEWRELLALRQLHAETARIGGLPLRRVAFQQLHGPACNFGAWLWNDRNQGLIAEVIFQWLLGEATVVGDSEAVELQRRNVAVATR